MLAADKQLIQEYLIGRPLPPCYLTLLGAGGPQVPVEDLLHHVGEEAGDHDDDDGEPGRAAGQQLHEHEVHVLGVEEGPGGRETDRQGHGGDRPQGRRGKITYFFPFF